MQITGFLITRLIFSVTFSDPYSAYELQFPDFKEEICYNSYVQRHLLEYTCLNLDLDVLSDPEDRCRMEISSRGCLMSYFQQLGIIDCTLADVTRVSQQQEFREGLLDRIEPNCELNLGDSDCMKQVYVKGRWRAERCFSFIYPMQELTLLKTTDVVNMVMSSSGNTSLKCSLFKEAVSCYMRNVQEFNIGGFDNISCTADDYAPAVTKVAHISYEIWSRSSWIIETNPVIPAEITYNECEASAADVFIVENCPSTESVADLVVGMCSSRILRGIRSYPDDPCIMEQTFVDCVTELPLSQNGIIQCPEDHIWWSIQWYSGYIAKHMGGFNLTQCQVSRKCKSLDFMIAEILPHCQNETDMLMKNAWEDGCQYFDAVVYCATQTLESRHLYCNHHEIKFVISDYTYEKTDYDWYYKDRCQRRRWLAELHFKNETFVAEMERNSTDVYRDFVRKYSNLINAVLSNYRGGQVIKLYEGSVVMFGVELNDGSVVMLLGFWAPAYPYDQINMVLQQRFEADMVNITVGRVTEDEDQNRCWDRVYINEIAVTQCRRELREVMNATEKCR